MSSRLLPQDDGSVDHPSAFLSPDQVGSIFGITAEAVRYWIRNSQLVAHQSANRRWHVRRADLEQFVRRQPYAAMVVVVLTRDPALHQCIAATLPIPDYRVTVASTAVDGLLKCACMAPQFLILDADWPEIWNIAEKIRRSRLRGRTSVVVLTERGLSDTELDRAIALRCKACVLKSEAAALLPREIHRIASMAHASSPHGECTSLSAENA